MAAPIAIFAPRCAPPIREPRSPARRPPKLSCDTHLHICGPQSHYAYAPDRVYTPPDALLGDYLDLAETLGVERAVFVQPSIYGTDNAAMLDAMQACPLESRGVAVVDADVSDDYLRSLHEAGVRGIRFNMVDVATPGPEFPSRQIRTLANRIESLGWHIELLIHIDDYPTLDELVGDVSVDVVLGHLGYFRPGRGIDDDGFRALLRLMRAGRCWTKLTGPYRVSAAELPYPGVEEFARSLVQEAPERVIWGTDWPHVMVQGAMPDDGDLLDLLFDWVPDGRARERILVENPARLYDFQRSTREASG